MRIGYGGVVPKGGAPGHFLDFSAGLNPDGAPDWVRAALEEGLARVGGYPDARSTAARAGLAAHLNLPERCVLPTNGGMAAAGLAASAPFPAVAPKAARRLGRTVIAQPTLREFTRLCGEHEDIRWDDLPRYEGQSGDTLWLCNPNAFTGGAFPREGMLALLERAEREGARLVVDEAFVDYCPGSSIRDAVITHEGLIVLGSLTSALAIPGARLGFIAAHPSVIALVEEALSPWRLNCFAEAVAEALPGHAADFERIRAVNAYRRGKLAQALRLLGAQVFPSEASFLLCDFRRDMRPVIEALRREGILVSSCGDAPGLTHAHIRVGVRTEDDNARLIDALRKLL